MILPLTNNPEENFSIVINEIVYNFRQLWNPIGFWTLDIKEADDTILVAGVKIIAQEFLLSQYSQLFFDLKSDADLDPTRNNLNLFSLEVTNKNV